MDTLELFRCCKRGDLPRISYLVEFRGVNLNVRDKWDSTPLYYACLCGHTDIVQYLLANGARCEANTFDGERCIYGALTNHIKKILLNYKVVTSQTMRRDLYDEFLRRLLETGQFSDFTFIVHGSHFCVHKCILAARSNYFCHKFQNKWKNRDVIVIKNKLVQPSAFRSLLQYIYTGRLETHIDTVDDCIRLAVQCKLTSLKKELEGMVKKITSFECTKPGTNIKILISESSELALELQQDLGILGLQAVPQEFRTWVSSNKLPHMPTVPLYLVDICFLLGEYKFWCHKAFFCGRSEYFNAVLKDHFCESEVDNEVGVPVVTIKNVPVEAFIAVLYYIYTNCIQVKAEYILDVLCAADMYLLSGLKRACGVCLANNLSCDLVVSRLKTARLFQLPQLEDQCTKFIAQNIDKMYTDPALHEVVLQDAQEVKEREETDSIPIVDDIRYHITCNVNSRKKFSEVCAKLRLIDKMLEELQLDA